MMIQLNQTNQDLGKTMINTLQIFPDSVIVNSNQPHSQIVFCNNSAYSELYDSEVKSDEEQLRNPNNRFVPLQTNLSNQRRNSKLLAEPLDYMTLGEILKYQEDQITHKNDLVETEIEQQKHEVGEQPPQYHTVKSFKITWCNFTDAYMHVFVNNTHIKNYEKEKAINKCFNMILSSISHEFRTPINAIRNGLSLLKLNCSNVHKVISQNLKQPEFAKIDAMRKDNIKYIKIADISSLLLLNSTENLLDLAKFESNKLEYVMKFNFLSIFLA